jgi:hypothetical protein
MIEAQSYSVAGHAGLADFERRRPNPKPVTDADLVVRQSVDRKILAENSVDEV